MAASYTTPRDTTSRGGLSTKIHLVVDGRGRPVDLRLTGGQGSDFVPALDPLDGKFAPAVIVDRGCETATGRSASSRRRVASR